MCISCVMLLGRRKSAYRYVMIGVCCSVDHCELLYLIGVKTMCTGDTGAALHAEFNKHVHEYTANYTNPVTSGQIQDELREKEIEDEEIESSLQQ